MERLKKFKKNGNNYKHSITQLQAAWVRWWWLPFFVQVRYNSYLKILYTPTHKLYGLNINANIITIPILVFVAACYGVNRTQRVVVFLVGGSSVWPDDTLKQGDTKYTRTTLTLRPKTWMAGSNPSLGYTNCKHWCICTEHYWPQSKFSEWHFLTRWSIKCRWLVVMTWAI